MTGRALNTSCDKIEIAKTTVNNILSSNESSHAFGSSEVDNETQL